MSEDLEMIYNSFLDDKVLDVAFLTFHSPSQLFYILLSLFRYNKAYKYIIINHTLSVNAIFNFIYKLPQQWSAASYQSMKPLSSWVADLVDRIEFLSKWATRGEPLAFWISGFYFPQGQ